MQVGDTSSLIAYWEGESGTDIEPIEEGLQEQGLRLVPPVIAELFGDPTLTRGLREEILRLPVLPLLDGYWERVGNLRAGLIAKGRKAKLADSLIAQACLDHDALLIARDDDFGAFAKLAGLKLVLR